ncbi:MAG TPA: hypothetical protein PLQ93_02455 [Bacteroidia bacterium]|nr:hypothetical protein [Bacteroidia bacterium]
MISAPYPVKSFSIALLLWFSQAIGQNADSLYRKEKLPFDRKEEIIYHGKRYAIHNNYLSLGAGFLSTSLRFDVQKTIGADYQFHIRRQQFQVGAMMSGEEFFSNNNVQAHIGYGLRKESLSANYAIFVGPTYFSGVAGMVGSPPDFYTGFGMYFSVQATIKIFYDIGLGAELFGEINYKQSIMGIKFIAFFSGAYRGPKRQYNPNVRSERGH